tara:strand:+ start:1389 stop:1880 length:492 start_codon:yes stop_codon:yes gene_type:complete
MITFRNAVGFLETIASKHHMINSFHSGFLDEVDINKLGAADYVILYAEPGTATVDKGVMTYSFNIYILDMINDEIGDAPNNDRLGRTSTLSENLQILQDVINEFHRSLYKTSWVDGEVVLELPISCEPFTARFDNQLTGWTATLSMQVDNKNNLCIVPILSNT